MVFSRAEAIRITLYWRQSTEKH